MQISLLDLLKRKTICHPSQTQFAEFKNQIFTLNLRGVAWWLVGPNATNQREITFRFENIDEAEMSDLWFHGGEDLEDLEDFSIEPIEIQPWVSDCNLDVYCNEPLKDKMAFLSVVEKFLEDSNCPWNFDKYLNMQSLSDFDKIASSSGYKICSAPEPISNKILGELSKQDVSYTVLRSEIVPKKRLLVRWHGGYLICRSATATFEE